MVADALTKTRGTVKGALTRFINLLNSDEVRSNIPQLKVMLSRNESLFDKFDNIQSQIEETIKDPDKMAEEEQNRLEFETLYYKTFAQVRSLIDRAEQNQTPSGTATPSPPEASSQNVLPKLNVPKFNGDFSYWVKFRDSFRAMIHDNQKLSNIEKFTYLNSALSGEAERVVSALGVSNENYIIAWNALKKRYEDENDLIHYYVSGIFEVPAMSRNSYSELRFLIDTFTLHLASLKALKEPTDQWDTLIIYLLKSKLHTAVKNDWEKEASVKTEKITLETVVTFLEGHCKFLNKTTSKTNSTESKENKFTGKPGNNKSNNSHQGTHLKNYALTASNGCVLCKGSHALYGCSEFLKLSPPLRLKKAQELQVCFNCLSVGHGNIECKRGSCRTCGRKHNSLLHLDTADKSQAPPRGPPKVSTQTAPQTSTLTESTPHTQAQQQKIYTTQAYEDTSSYVLLGTAVVYLYDRNGEQHECRALLDSCSQPHIITTELCNRLGLQQTRTNITLSGIEQGNQEVMFKATAKLKSRVNDFSTSFTCLVVDNISDDLPSTRVQSAGIQIPDSIVLADPNFDKSRPVDLLLGTSLFYQLLCVGQVKLNKEQPILQKTLLGWIVAGNINLPTVSRPNKVICRLIKNSELNTQLQKFWEIEHCFSEQKSSLSKNDYAEKHFNSTTTRDSDGRFIVSIPFKEEVSQLGLSMDMAYKRLISMEKKLDKNEELKEQYHDFMEEYEELDHMGEITPTECDNTKPHFYLPHHAIVKEASISTKLRVVFDGSASTSTGLSLNNVQYIGTIIQDELFLIVLRFRQYLFVISADIAKMYRQIKIKIEQRPMQRILWRKESHLPVKIFELNTVTYGTASAPFLATRCLYQLGIDNKDTFPSASKAIMHDFYVDDLLTGAQTLQEAIGLRNEINYITSTAGFELRKWASNDPRVLYENDCKENDQVISIYGDKDPKTLGLVWDPSNDILKYRVNCTDSRKVTKRTILSIIAQIFDPLGLVGPAIIQAKVIMQRLWSINLDWDESVPQEIHSSWIEIYDNLLGINKITIKRHVMSPDHEQLEFHGFCDASERAYGACIYICSINKNGTRSTQLLCAKSRVAPLKTTTIPRLELLSAQLLAQLAHKVESAYNTVKEQWYYWSDSMVTLAWIKSPANKWKIFVANRTAEIQELTNENWHHVESKQNPADLISRGITASELAMSDLWWNGPDWLSQGKESWPTFKNTVFDEMPEQKKSTLSFLIEQETAESTSKNDFNLFSRFSSYTRMIRSIAFILRFISNCKRRVTNQHPKQGARVTRQQSKQSATLQEITPLSTAELYYATRVLIKRAQAETFSLEISKLNKGQELHKTSHLIELNPFIDRSGILRVGGRLSNAEIPYDQKHPIILDKNHNFTHLLIKHEHIKLLHAGCQTVLFSLRKRFWPLSGKNTVKGVLKDCLTCFKAKPVDTTQFMGDLPATRLTPTRAFYNCGVDYAGPFYIKEKLRSKTQIKVYICIFVCFATKAIHIELACDLSTDAFLNCFKRFFSRRGKCHNIYSDNGTNFVGARNELAELYEFLQTQHVQNNVNEFLSSEQVNWHFIPPRSPHFGGLWEGAVKSAKYHLKRVIGDTHLTYEELYTLLTQIEACLNSRPLSPLSNDPNDLTPLTPGHFLIGDALTAFPQADLRDINTNRLDRYQHVQQMLQHFWNRWQSEYLPQLQGRTKWNKKSGPKIMPGQLVLLKEDNVPPMQWPLGRITEVHLGKDNMIRVVSIQTARGITKRGVSKICILPNQENEIKTKEESPQQLEPATCEVIKN